MTDVMMGLGEFRFSIDTAAYQSLRRSNEWRWASQPRIGRRPALQAVGVGAHTITLSGFILPHWRGGLKRLDEMRVMGDKMEPLALTDGNGLVWGEFVITRLSETQSSLNERGQPRKQEFQLTLKQYGSDNDPV